MANRRNYIGKSPTAGRGDVRRLRADSMVGQVYLSWDAPDSGVAAIEILGRYDDEENFELLTVLSPDSREAVFYSEPLCTIHYRVRLRYDDGRGSRGKTITTSALHKNVVADAFNGRNIFIYLPDGYYDDDRLYPALYMMDGQNLFTDRFSFAGGWHADKVMDWLIEADLIEKFIIVGIFNGEERDTEYTPYEDPEEGGGGAADFADFLVDGVIPWAQDKYRISPFREDRGIMGSSYGGLFSAWTAINYPELFSFAGAMSPSFWHTNGAILEDFAGMDKLPLRFWICHGTEEWSMFTRPAVDILLDKGYEYGEELVYYEVNGMDHSEAAWGERLCYPFIFFRGQTAEEMLDLNVEFEVVRDEDYGDDAEFYLNPVADFDNGIRYSLYREAQYTSDSEGIYIDDAGRVFVIEQEDFTVTAGFGESTESADVSYEELEEEMMLLYEKQAGE